MTSPPSMTLEEIAGEPYILMEEGHYSEPMKAIHTAGLEPQIQNTPGSHLGPGGVLDDEMPTAVRSYC